MMKIGIIGAGNIGGALTRLFRTMGHDVTVANSRGPASLVDLARETGARAVSVEEVVFGNDIVVVAIPQIGSRTFRPGCSATRPGTWSSSIPETTIHKSATAASTESRQA